MAGNETLVLLNAVNVTGAGAWQHCPAGEYTFFVDASSTFAPTKLEIKGPAGTAFAAGTDTTLAAIGGGNVNLPPCDVRANITSGSPSGVTAVLKAR